ncbi:Uncharacterized protein conserved in bacteria [Thermoplasmatales archaeon BRNA1]|nr:Uncharacterized protein conserved in bacteria [Thermoplasmatales archaeon BRNA1]
MTGKIGFDSQKYYDEQSGAILKRMQEFGGKLYLEVGGKIFDDLHASRVLPGFTPDSKIRMIAALKDKVEAIVAVNCNDIEKSKIRGDYGITYDAEALRMLDEYRSYGIEANVIVLTMYAHQPHADAFRRLLDSRGIKSFLHYPIEGYPNDTATIVSDEGYGKNEFVETDKPVVVVSGPGPGSGKMAVCMSQVYLDNKKGIKSGYAKYETFPVWNLPLNHPVNIAYEAATADLGDINAIDPWHMEAYGKIAINYNRDIESFPVLKALLEKIYGECPYKSPTDMGVNIVGSCITDDDAVCIASKREIVRRFFKYAVDGLEGKTMPVVVERAEALMRKAGTSPNDFELYRRVHEESANTACRIAGLELPDGTVVTGKATSQLSAVSAVMINGLKHLAGIDYKQDIIAESIIRPIQMLRTEIFGSDSKRLRLDEMLTALAVSAETNPDAAKALSQIGKLRGCDIHASTTMYAQGRTALRKLGINATSEPVLQTRLLYQSK